MGSMSAILDENRSVWSGVAIQSCFDCQNLSKRSITFPISALVSSKQRHKNLPYLIGARFRANPQDVRRLYDDISHYPDEPW